MRPAVAFHNVSKKFSRGERHDSFRDLVPSLVKRAFRGRPAADSLTSREFWALRDVSFEVAPGEALGIIGANGAGKSTTLKVLTRILKPTTGRSSVTGRVGALIEVAAGFHPDLTGKENVFLQGAIMGMKRQEIAERFDEIVEFAGVAQFIDTPVKRYSSGMNARLGFSIAAHLRPDVLIIDEVLSVGDMSFQRKCFDRMLTFKHQGIAIVLVSHNLQAVGSLCDRAIFLVAGAVKSLGKATDVLSAYVQAAQDLEDTSAGHSIEITSIGLTGGEARGSHAEVTPGAAVTLSVTAKSPDPLEDVTFGLLVHRSTDQLLVYDGNVHRRDVGSAADFCGEFALDVNFRANLVRGHYYVSLYVYHNPTGTFLAPKRQVATLSVQENRTWGGVADVDVAISLAGRSTTARPVVPGSAAAIP